MEISDPIIFCTHEVKLKIVEKNSDFLFPIKEKCVIII